MFDEYTKINSEFISKYGWIEDKYPHAILFLDKILRAHIKNEPNIVERDITIQSTFNFKLFFYYLCVGFFWDFFNRRRTVFLSLTRFDFASNLIKSKLDSKGFRVIKGGRYLRIPATSSFLNYIKLVFLFKKLKKIGLNNALNTKFLKVLDQVVAKDVSYVSKKLSKVGIEFIFMQNDSSPLDRLICKAANKVNCKVIVLAHGYIQCPSLITIAPIFSDRLCVWTEHQKDCLVKVLTGDNRKKVKYLGSFLGHSAIISKLDEKNSLIVLEPLPKDTESRNRFVDILTCYLKSIQDAGFSIIIRPHPTFKNDAFSFFNSGLFNIEVSTCDNVYDDIERSLFVLGTNSSVLVQAGILGKPAYQVEELKKCYFEYADVVNLKEFVTKLNSINNQSESKRSIDLFNVDAAIDFLK